MALSGKTNNSMMNARLVIAAIIAVASISGAREVIAGCMYVDKKLQGKCVGTYSIRRRNNSGKDGDAFPTPQMAADCAKPGDTILIRQGVYFNITDTKQRAPVLKIVCGGEKDKPIVFKNYNNELVVFSGINSNNTPHKFNCIAIGGAPSTKKDSSGTWVKHVVVSGIVVEGATHAAIEIFGPANRTRPVETRTSDIVLRGIIARNNKGSNNRGGGIRTKGAVEHIVIEYCEAYNNTGGGIGFGRMSKKWHRSEHDTAMSAARYSVIRDCLVYRNSHPQYPGNTDGMGGSNMYRCVFENNVVFDNSDDGIDVYSSFEAKIRGNIVFYHNFGGGNNTGIKFSAGGGGRHILSRNIVFGNKSYCFECSKPKNPIRSYYGNILLHNLANGGSRGLNIDTGFIKYPGFEKIVLLNNIVINTKKDVSAINAEWLFSDYNYISDNGILKKLQKAKQDRHSLSIGVTLPVNMVVDTIFNSAWSTEQKLLHIREQVHSLIGTGTKDAIVDRGSVLKRGNIDGLCKTDYSFRGNAPDIGPYEFKQD